MTKFRGCVSERPIAMETSSVRAPGQPAASWFLVEFKEQQLGCAWVPATHLRDPVSGGPAAFSAFQRSPAPVIQEWGI